MSVDLTDSGDGYLTVPLIDRRTVKNLRRVFRRLQLPKDHGFHATSANGTRESARASDQLLKAELAEQLRSILPSSSAFLAAFISKGVSQSVTVDFHQDWTYTDERTDRAVLVWVPLVDVTAANGAMRVVPGSHRWTSGLRASGTPLATARHQHWFASRSVPVEIEAGTALVYDAALVHGSSPNRSSKARPAVAVALAPERAQLVHFHVDNAQEMTGWAIDEAHFTTRPFASRPEHCRALEPWAALVDEKDFLRDADARMSTPSTNC